MHRHGRFQRMAPNGEAISIQRYICPNCRSTCSVLKDGMLPYRRLCSKELQECLDKLQTSPKSQPKGSHPLIRAVKTFHQRALRLHARLWLPVAVSLNPPIMAQRLWQALRQRYGDITAILHQLAANCRTSLLHDYRSLVVRS
jgi:uncharacterized protein DUF6431